MKRTLAITAAAAMLALSLAACGADDTADTRYGTDDVAGATDTMRNGGDTLGTGMNEGAATNGAAADYGLGGVAGAVNGAYGPARYGAARSGRAAKDAGETAWNTDASWNPDAAAADARYERMLENGRVHDRDGFLLDGENASWRTF